MPVLPPAPPQPPAGAPHPVIGHFQQLLRSEHFEESLPVVAIKALLKTIEGSTAATMMGLHEEMVGAQGALKVHVETDPGILQSFGRGSVLPLLSACELFVRHVERTFVDFPGNFEDCKSTLLSRGSSFVRASSESRKRIASLGAPFIREGAKVLTHGTSRVVLALLVAAAEQGRNFSVVVTECSGGAAEERVGVEQHCAMLRRAGIPVTIVPDSAVASIMELVDLAIVGAEAVCESGGVINRTGTYQVGIVCSATATPLYVAAESLKFSRLYPLNQQDLPPQLLQNPKDGRKHWEVLSSPGVDLHAPRCDFTPAKLVTLLFTDLGVLTPAAVSDELIKLYQ